MKRQSPRPRGTFNTGALWGLLTTVAGCSSAVAASFVTINATFDYGSLSPSDQATFASTIDSALSFYTANLQTPTPLTVNIQFASDTGVALGQSSTYINTISYSSFRSHLAANAGSAADTTALANLPSGSSNPVNGNSQVTASLPLLRALGFTGAGVAAPGGLDATVSLNTSLMNLTRTGAQDPSKYDLQAVVQHEVDEVLGFGSALNGLSNGAPTPTGAIQPLDLFRYDISGSRSFSTSASAGAYLSIDGVTQLAQFNQTAGGDFSDFAGPTVRVQNAFGTPGAQPDLSTAEKTALDVLGYNFASVPEPGPALIASGILLAGFAGLRHGRLSRG